MTHSKRSFSQKAKNGWLYLPAYAHILIAAVVGAGAAALVGTEYSWSFALLVLWDVAALIVSGGRWLSIRGMDAKETKEHATQDDPGRGFAAALILIASVVSLVAVVVLVIDAGKANGLAQALDIVLGVASVIISWTSVHLIYTLRYADLYFKDNNAIDFNSSQPPTFQDFAYVAFTIGMTYQVSDTSLKSTQIRKTARQHAILSYVFGTAIIATTINAIAGLGK